MFNYYVKMLQYCINIYKCFQLFFAYIFEYLMNTLKVIFSLCYFSLIFDFHIKITSARSKYMVEMVICLARSVLAFNIINMRKGLLTHVTRM